MDFNQGITHVIHSLPLSPRERECIFHMLDGRSAADSAEEMGISRWSVYNFFKSIYLKLGLNTKEELFAFLINQLREEQSLKIRDKTIRQNSKTVDSKIQRQREERVEERLNTNTA